MNHQLYQRPPLRAVPDPPATLRLTGLGWFCLGFGAGALVTAVTTLVAVFS